MISPGITFTQSPDQLPAVSSSKSQTDYKMEFLKMMLTEMQNQDPTKPIDSTQMLAQQAQFASLEQMQNINTSMVTLLAMQNVNQATNLLGKTVTGKDDTGVVVTGSVAGIGFDGGVSSLKVDVGGGVIKNVKLPDVTEVGI